MKRIFVVVALLCAALGVRASADIRVKSEADKLLGQWVSELMRYQIRHQDPALDGGLLCPACCRVHGRSGDAVVPLMYMAQKTGQTKYVDAAKRLMSWQENVHRIDGAWMNDVNVSDWAGTTLFAALALEHALEHYSTLLDDSTSRVWHDRLLSAGEFIYRDKDSFCRQKGVPGQRNNQNINYACGSLEALWKIGKRFNRPEFIARADSTAKDIRGYFTTNEQFLYGEGPWIYAKTPNGCLPVDLLYNVEESLPSLMRYSLLTGDKELYAMTERSMLTALEFMLPDGAWDDSWGTRGFKWCYWGGRTSDSALGIMSMMASKHPQMVSGMEANIALMRSASADGLMAGGMHYRQSGIKPCIHHSFVDSKTLVEVLEGGLLPEPLPLPRSGEYGVKYFKDINSWLVAHGGFRATVTAYDAEYKVKGSHPIGGALSMLWHEKVGPLFAASMSTYNLVEAPNMQQNMSPNMICATPRVEVVKDGVMFSNLDDLAVKVTPKSSGQQHSFVVDAQLVDLNQKAISESPCRVEYIFTKSALQIKAHLSPELLRMGARMVLPLILLPEQSYSNNGNEWSFDRGTAKVSMVTTSAISIAPVDANGRLFNYAPGFSLLPLVVAPDKNGDISVVITVV